jgi:phosphoserine phosphatase
MYIEQLSPGVEDALSSLRRSGWHPIIISGGFTQVIEPVAEKLGITEIHAVPLQFNEDGSYCNFDHQAPTARNGGKPDIIRQVTSARDSPQTVMLGDGVSDWETTPVVDLFIGYGGVVCREKVKSQANAFITSFLELKGVILKRFPQNIT